MAHQGRLAFEDSGRSRLGARPLIAIPARFSSSAAALRYEAEVSARKLVEAVYAAGGEPLSVHPSAPGGAVSEADVARRLEPGCVRRPRPKTERSRP